MANLNVLDLEGKQKGKIDIADNIVSQEANDEILHQEVRRYLAAGRSGTHKTKERSEVSGGGRKPWRQKGTGNARAGSNRSPLWRHGGITFGPKPRDYSFKLNRKVIRKSKLIALTEKFKNDRIIVVDRLDFEEPATKKAYEILVSLKISGEKVLLALDSAGSAAGKSFRNIPEVKVVSIKGLNTYDILIADYLFFTKKSLTDFIKGLGDERS
ncbi:MAG: 50S ribosomal protein L4 [Actinobacteria bacterium ADurb.Bin346]|nr:MAG: 50S ribosomal protein L4 [Actinobacteria bacterium ADurb.Bin346]